MIHTTLSMGGYGSYVWSAYAIVLGYLAAQAMVLVMKRRRLLRARKLKPKD
jgi:heme exporter protein CcmD